MGRGIHFGRIFGIRLFLDWTVILIFLLVVTNLALGVLPAWHPTWGAGLVWGVAVAAGVLLLASILVHELAHALVGRAYGTPVRSITLFIFGGVTDIEREPSSPRAEFFMALVGPLTSFAVGIAFIALARLLVGGELLTLAETDPAAALAAMGPVATLLFWIGPLNILLAIFNMVPGYPLDGGRVLRAALWSLTGNLQRATLWASRAGQLFAWALIIIGITMMFGTVWPVLGGGLTQGLWLAFIGWFLHSAAVMGYRQLVIRSVLEDVPVTAVMGPPAAMVTPEMSLQQLVDDYVMRSDQLAFPVSRGDGLLGIVSLTDVRKIPRDQWSSTRVSEVMTPANRLHTVQPEQDAYVALRELGHHGVGQLPVMREGHMLGLVRRTDIARWLALQTNGELGAVGAGDISVAPRGRRREVPPPRERRPPARAD